VTWQTGSHPDVFPLAHISEMAAGRYQERFFVVVFFYIPEVFEEV